MENPLAWLEAPNTAPIPIRGHCSFGRMSPPSTVAIPDPSVSRCHAEIRVQCGSADALDAEVCAIECRLVDFGSLNGTYLNERRVIQSQPLKDGDRIRILDHIFTFRCPQALPDFTRDTMPRIEIERRWLFHADLENSSRIATAHRERRGELAPNFGRWLDTCRRLVEAQGGEVNKYGGDGVFVTWRGEPRGDHPGTDGAAMARHLREWRAEIEDAERPFRAVLHFGDVEVGGAPSLGEESLISDEVHFVHRLEKAAGELGERLLLSTPAAERVRDWLPLRALPFAGDVKGFPGPHVFYAPE